MRLNGLKLNGYFMADGDRPCFELACTVAEIAALNGKTLTVTEDGDTVEEFFAYEIDSISKSPDGTYYAHFARRLDDASKKAIEGIEASLTAMQADLSATAPQLQAVARLSVASIDFSSVSATDVAAIADYIPAWEEVGHFEQNDPCVYGGTIYRASKAHDRQEQYDPVTAGESMYYPVDVAEDGIIVYRDCRGDYDMVRKGEKRHYPGADGPVYTALEDTSYSPDAYPQHWKADSEEQE